VALTSAWKIMGGLQMTGEVINYTSLLDDIKGRIRRAQTRAVLSANREMLILYWDVGRIIQIRQDVEGWGASVIPRLSRDLRNDLPKIKGFSKRNLKRMVRFYREYPALIPIATQDMPQSIDSSRPKKVPQPVALLHPVPALGTEAISRAVLGLPWSHNFILIEKVKDIPIRFWYMQQTLVQGWSRKVLDLMIMSNAHERQGKAISNFDKLLPASQSGLSRQTFKDPYIFDFLTLDNQFRERELEAGLVAHLERFMLELGVGFSFVGRQYHISVGEDDFSLDLLFYHLKLRCFVVIDLKVGGFKPDYAGKMNFYLNVVDDMLRHEHDNPSIGLILCRDKKKILAEYALRGVNKPIGVSEYALTRSLPDALKSSLPTIEDIEGELATR
jgi:predicted nuclease of restriction endonuclease-like (RecB) superfamily